MDGLALDRLELGKLYFKIVNFDQAIGQLAAGLKEARVAEDWNRWCQYLPLLLRIYAERMEFEQISSWKAELFELECKGVLKASSAVHYTLGIAACFEAKLDIAENHFEESLRLAVEVNESAQARFGLCVVSSQRGRHDETLSALRELDETLRATLLTDLQLATRLLMAVSHRGLRQYEEALAILGPLQEISRGHQNLFMSLNVLYCYGTVCQQMRDTERARQYFETVRSLLAPKDLRHLDSQIQKRLAELKPVFQFLRGTDVVTPEGRRVGLGNQFILKALLTMLAEVPGRTIDKEMICQTLWKQEYNPLIHDNKIYVTIRRLRRMIEPDGQAPSYILSSPDGYVFNPNVEFRNLA